VNLGPSAEKTGDHPPPEQYDHEDPRCQEQQDDPDHRKPDQAADREGRSGSRSCRTGVRAPPMYTDYREDAGSARDLHDVGQRFGMRCGG
jgi:hypothetical protein